MHFYCCEADSQRAQAQRLSTTGMKGDRPVELIMASIDSLKQINSLKQTRLWGILANTPRLMHLVWSAAPRWLVLSLIITLLGSLIPVGQLYVSKLIVDRVIQSLGQSDPDWTPLTCLIGMGLTLTLLQGGLNQASTFVSQVLNDRFTLHANHVMLQQAVRLDLAHYELPEFYDILTRAQQSGSTYPVKVLTTLTALAGQILTFAGLLTLLIRFNPVILVLLMLTSVPAFWVGVRFSGRRFVMLRNQTQSGRFADYLQRVLTNQNFVKEVRLFNLSDHLLSQWRGIRTSFNEESSSLAAQQTSVRFGMGIVANLGFYVAYACAIVQTVQGAISIGDLAMYSGAFQQSQNVIQGILLNIALTYEFNLYISQFFEFLNLEPRVVNAASPRAFPVPLQQGLVLRDVTFTYPGASKPTLRNLNLTVQPGESIALVGVNGAGKTTLLKLLTRFYDIDSGEITIDGISIQQFDLNELRRNVGVIFQDFARYNLSVQDNIGFGDLREYRNQARIHKAAIDAGATEVIKKLDRGYETMLGKIFPGGAELSGGQWQKIGLARAFMTPAQILILDEPTAALDAIAEYDLFQRFRRLTQGKMTFLVSHRFSTVRMADRIVVLEKGRIVEVGSHTQLMAQGGLYERMFQLQASSYSDVK
jgi:ATP-binding cassette subfamily B protein